MLVFQESQIDNQDTALTAQEVFVAGLTDAELETELERHRPELQPISVGKWKLQFGVSVDSIAAFNRHDVTGDGMVTAQEFLNFFHSHEGVHAHSPVRACSLFSCPVCMLSLTLLCVHALFSSIVSPFSLVVVCVHDLSNALTMCVSLSLTL